MNLSRRNRWILIAIACVIGAGIAAAGLGWFGWVQGWVGALFKAASGGALGWAVSRYIVGLDLSAIEEQDVRAVAGLSQAILIGFGALAVASGA